MKTVKPRQPELLMSRRAPVAVAALALMQGIAQALSS